MSSRYRLKPFALWHAACKRNVFTNGEKDLPWLQRLASWGVHRIFGYPGDDIMGAFGRTEDIEFIHARHEELAAFMACAHAKFTGEVGVCLATSGSGAIHLLHGLYDAKLNHHPVVAIVGQQKRAALGVDYQQEVDLLPCSSMSRTSSYRWQPRRNRYVIWWTARCASRAISAR